MNVTEVEEALGRPVSFLSTPLWFNGIICIVSLATFVLLCSRVPWCFRPRSSRTTRKDRRVPPPDISFASFEWIRVMFTLPEDVLLQMIGLDALVFIRFHRLGLAFFLPCSIVATIVLLPLNIMSRPWRPDVLTLETISMVNVPTGSPVFYVHFISVILFTAYLFILLDREARAYHRLRHKYHLRLDEFAGPRPEQLSIYVRQVPSHLMTSDNFERYMASLFPNSVAAATLVYDRSKLLALVKKRDRARRHLEDACVKYVRAPNRRLPTYRPRLCGAAVDAISHWSDRIDELNGRINLCRQQHLQATSSGYVTFMTFTAASRAVNVLLTSEPFKLVTTKAVEPRDIYWPCVHLKTSQKQLRSAAVRSIVFALIMWWTVMVAAVNSLFVLSSLKHTFPFLEPLLQGSPLLLSLVQSILPSIGTLILQLLLPPILLIISKFQGYTSKSAVQASVFRKFYLFQFFNFFLAAVISMSIIHTLLDLMTKPATLPARLSESFSLAAGSFTTYVLLQALGRVPMQLLRLGDLLVGWFTVTFLARTPEALVKATEPGPFMFAREWPMHLLLFTLGITYAQVFPLILPCVALFFFVGSFVYRYLLIFVHEPKFESGGQFVPLVCARILIGAVIGQLTLIGLFTLKEAYVQAALMLVLIPATYYFHLHCLVIFAAADDLACDEVVDYDQPDRFDVKSFTEQAPLFYQQPCEIGPDVDSQSVQAYIFDSADVARRAPQPGALKELVELERRRTTGAHVAGTSVDVVV